MFPNHFPKLPLKNQPFFPHFWEVCVFVFQPSWSLGIFGIGKPEWSDDNEKTPKPAVEVSQYVSLRRQNEKRMEKLPGSNLEKSTDFCLRLFLFGWILKKIQSKRMLYIA